MCALYAIYVHYSLKAKILTKDNNSTPKLESNEDGNTRHNSIPPRHNSIPIPTSPKTSKGRAWLHGLFTEGIGHK